MQQLKKKRRMKTTSTEVEEDVYFEKEKLSFSIVKRYFLYIDEGMYLDKPVFAKCLVLS